MKKFKNIFEESPAADYKPKVDDEEEVKGYKPRSPGEEKFLKLHKVDKKNHPVASDTQHTGDRPKGKTGKTGEDHDGAEEKGEPILKTYNQFMKLGGHGGNSYKGVGKSAGEKAAVMQGSSKIKEEIEEQYLGTNDSERLNGGKSKDPRFRSPGSHIDYHHRQSGGHLKSGGEADKHRYQVAKKLGYMEEVEIDEGSRTFGSASKKAEVSRQRAIEKAKRWMKSTGKSAAAAVKEFDLFSSDIRKLKEEVELVDEAFKAGKIQFKDGKYKVIDEKTASILNNAMKQLNTTNRKRMETEAKKDTQSFEAMLKFAKAAA